MSVRFAAKTVLLGLAFGLAAFGDPIVIFNTGETSGGSALAIGTADSHYSVISSPLGALTPLATSINPVWAANLTTAEWISPGNSGNLGWPVGTYDYRTTFDLTGLDPTTAQLSGQWTTDNSAEMYLDGVDTGLSTTLAGFGSLHAFAITTGFQSGVNTLDFVVYNAPLSIGNPTFNPTGLFVEVSGNATAVPEPPALIFLSAVALGSLVIPRWRRALRR